jgi:hypothetical protein
MSFLTAALAFAGFDESHFNYGRQWSNSFNENTDFSGKGLSHLAIWVGDNAFYKKEQWALQWHARWLELAEKFKDKEAK